MRIIVDEMPSSTYECEYAYYVGPLGGEAIKKAKDDEFKCLCNTYSDQAYYLGPGRCPGPENCPHFVSLAKALSEKQ